MYPPVSLWHPLPLPLPLLLSWWLFAGFGSAQASCYYPGGKLVGADTPCDPDASHSMCCAPGDICLSNKLCFVPNINHYHRGSCTDSSWSSGNCTDICTSFEDAPYGYTDVMPCPGSSPPAFYCGYDNVDRCNSGPNQKSFGLPDGWFADYRNTSSSSRSTSSSSARITATTAPSSSSSCPAIARTVTVSVPPPASSSGTAVAGSGAGLNFTALQSCPSQNNVKAGIGAGVGIPLALGLAASLLLLRRERRLRKELVNGQRLVSAQPWNQYQPGKSQPMMAVHEADSGQERIYEAPP